MEGLNQLAAQLKTAWEKMGPRARALTTMVALAVGLGMLFTAVRPGPGYALLYADLEPKDAAQMVAVLDSAQIKHEIEGGGTILRVPSDDVDRARLLLAEQSLPAGTAGWSVLDQTDWGAPTSVIETNRLRALQGELERTIVALDAVSAARVHLAVPKRAVFADEKQPATASVTLDLAPGRPLPPNSVGAIQHLVGAAVPGLVTEEVTIVDTKGTLLSRSGADPAAAAALDYRRDLEQRLGQRVSRLLERTVGVGGAHATVSADIDFAAVETTEEIYDPEQTAVRTESLQEAIENPQRGAPKGLAGAIANEPGANTGAMTGGKASASRTTKTKAYEVNRTVVHTTGPAAQLKRLTVSVLVDGTYTSPEDGGEPVFTPRTTEELAELQKVVENAVGYNAARGDRISVLSVPFVDRPRIDGELLPPEPPFPSWLPYAAGGGVLLLIGGVFMVMRKKGAKSTAVTPQVLQTPIRVDEAQRALSQAESGALDGAQAAAALPAADVNFRDRAVKASDEDPERTAEIIKAWMSDAA